MKTPPDFLIAKKMPVGTRLGWVAVLAFAGIAIQLLLSLVLGWLFVFAAVLIGAPKGKSNEPHFVAAGEWQNVTTAEFEEAAKLLQLNDSVSRTAGTFSIASGMGCFLWILMVIAVFLIGVIIHSTADQGVTNESVFSPVVRGGSLTMLFIIDALTLLAPIWFFGRVSTWEPPNIRMRLDQLMSIYKETTSNPVLECQPCLSIAKSVQGTVPTDCKLMYKVKDSDPNFMGIQVQTSLNDVQSKLYPYTYCVLIAKPELGLLDKAKEVVDVPPRDGFALPLFGLLTDSNTKKESKFARFGDVLVELKEEGEVEIAVVRQNTSGNGYTTSTSQAYVVFKAACELASKVLGRAI